MAETSGLLNRRTGDSRTEGSNPSVSASADSSFRYATGIAFRAFPFPDLRATSGFSCLLKKLRALPVFAEDDRSIEIPLSISRARKLAAN